jgi:hypothetical protein
MDLAAISGRDNVPRPHIFNLYWLSEALPTEFMDHHQAGP